MDILQSTTALRFLVTEKLTSIGQSKSDSFAVAAPKSVALAHKLFGEIPVWDTFGWNNLIQTYLSNGDFHLVLSTYDQMLHRGVRPDRHTLPRAITASRLCRDLFMGRQLHGQAFKLGFSTENYATTALIEMYGQLDSLDMAKLVFDKSLHHENSVSWTLLARLYVDQGEPSLALHLFHKMVDLGLQIDSVSLATAFTACSSLKSLQLAKIVHEIARNRGLESDLLVSNSLLKMYIDCSSIKNARLTFDQMPYKDIISWTSIIQAYVKKGGFNEALKLFRRMNLDGLKPDALTISSILPSCGRISSHKHGKEIHGYLLRNCSYLNIKVKNALMDMYVKSGDMASASIIFIEMHEKDTFSWTVMIMGYSLHGQGKLGVDLFCLMEKSSNAQVDETTYIAVLHACCSARMVEEGRIYFNHIRSPTIAHYSLMVALLARVGLFDEAKTFVEEHKLERHAVLLRNLLDGCRIHHQHSLGKRVIEQLCELEPLNADNYVLLSNWYAGCQKWDMVGKLRGTIRDMGLKPRRAYTWIVHRNKVHVFGTGDVSHPRCERIYSELEHFMEEMRVEGHGLACDFSFHDVDEERECVQIGHSELLALSFGLISSQAGTIRLTKNHRVCRGCHESAKFISRTSRREIILKDPNLFHHFKDGFCSCGDLW